MSQQRPQADESVDEQNGYVRFRLHLTRGDGVRDVDEVTGELVCGDMDEFKAEVDGFRDYLYTQMSRARKFDPDADAADVDAPTDAGGDTDE